MSKRMSRLRDGRSCLHEVSLAHCRLIALCVLIGIFRASAEDSAEPSTRKLAEMSIEELMNVSVTSVSKRETKLSQSPAAVALITQNDIQRLGITSIPEALRWMPGMDVGRIDSHTWAISARGFQGEFGNKLLVLIDGRTIYEPGFAGVFWDVQDLPIEDLDRIEVIRGPGATLWGANAVNGVVNSSS
jgi:iron complex outermembrane receptor protein